MSLNFNFKPGISALLLAAMGGHTDAVEMLLKYGAHIDVVDTVSDTCNFENEFDQQKQYLILQSAFYFP